MSYIDELRERFVAAEQRFGLINEAGRAYRDRLMGLMSRIEEEIRCRRDVERQQAQEIERLSGEIETLSGENEQLRTMMMSLLTAVETGETDTLGNTLNEMDTKVATLIGEGQGAAVHDAPADPAGMPDAAEASTPASFAVGDMMEMPGREPSFEGEDVDPDQDDDAVSDEMTAQHHDIPAPADEARTADHSPDATATDPSDSEGDTASDMAEFFGSDGAGADDSVPAYSHAVAGWEDFLDDEEEPTAAAPGTDDGKEALSEVSEDFVAAEAGDPEAGSIHDLIDRAQTAVDGEDETPAASEETGEDDAGKAAAQ